MKTKVLIVDDEETCVYFLSSCLEEEGYEVKSSLTGSEAVILGKSFKPSILITDWMLKDGKDGVEVAEELTALDPSLKVVFITGMSSEVIKERLKGMPYLAIIEKPVDLEGILKILAS
jgi:two-component system cell cycle sensor histidine kinase/response regulator CckA